MQVHGWGRYPVVDAEIFTPSTSSGGQVFMRQFDGSLIPRGRGRSYGDSSLAANIVATDYLNLLLDFDEGTGTVKCGAGVTLATLLDVFVPRGWFLPVTPGTKFVSVGGAIASDVHGKNHHVDGCFSAFVERFSLLAADGSVLSCSRSENADLFAATCGGMGLTGIIIDATIRLRPIRSTYIEQTTYKMRNLEDTLQMFSSLGEATYSVAWIDCLAGGASLGRSLLMVGEHAQCDDLSMPAKSQKNLPVDLPSACLNRFSIQAFNTLYYHRIRTHELSNWVHYEPFFYPLDGILNWNRMYGRNGFTQYQFVVPRQSGMDAIAAILRRISESGRASFLSVLKAFGPANDNLLSFPMEGYTLALDFKLTPGLFDLLNELDAMVLDCGGRLYLTKDARMSEATFKKSYPNWERFQTVRHKYGAVGRFCSLQSRRIGLDS